MVCDKCKKRASRLRWDKADGLLCLKCYGVRPIPSNPNLGQTINRVPGHRMTYGEMMRITTRRMENGVLKEHPKWRGSNNGFTERS